MSKKQILTLTVLFISIVSLAVIQKYIDKNSYSTKSEKLLSVNTGLVDKIILTNPNKEVITLSKTGNNWNITTPILSRADNTKVNEILEAAKNMINTGTISNNKDKFDQFEVNEKGTHVEFFQNNEKKTGFILGKISDDYIHTYVRKDTEDMTLLAKGILQGSFQIPLLNLRDKNITRLKAEEVAEIIFKSNTNKLTLKNSNNTWESTPKLETSPNELKNIINVLLTINAENILEPNTTKREEIITKADLKLFIRRTNNDLKSTILYLKTQENKLYATEESSQDIYEIKTTIQDEIAKIFK